MRAYRFAVATAAATFVLLVIGGLVHATGSSLACPDWPLCNGEYFPRMSGGVLFEHGHRLAALTVLVLTLALAVVVWRSPVERRLKDLSALALALVLFQAALGAVTVLMRLPLAVSAGHLATSMAFFSLLIYLAFRLRPARGTARRFAPRWQRRLAGAAAAAVYLQLVIGALVRHTSAGLACNTTVLTCDGALWPAWGPAQLHWIHRLFGLAVAALVAAASAGPLRDALRGGTRFRLALAAAGPLVAVVQVALGVLTVLTYIAVPMTAAHVAGGALLLAVALSLYLDLGPLGSRAADGARTPAALGGHAPAEV